ncbi:MAG: nucleotidyltransferase family protein [Armatimonadota bacterium]
MVSKTTIPTLAVILAAGKGSRMKSLTLSTPKHMLSVAGKPMLEHVITRLKDAGIGRFVIVTGYLGHIIEDYFSDGSKLGVNISYVHQPEPNGTGSAVHSTVEAVGSEPFIATFGDILASTDTYLSLISDFGASPCDALLALNWVDDPSAGAAVYLDESSQVEKIVEKPPVGQSSTNWNQAGIFVFSPTVFEYTGKLVPSPRGEYELTDAVASMLADGRFVRGHRMSGIWCDVGRPEDIGHAAELLEKEQ